MVLWEEGLSFSPNLSISYLDEIWWDIGKNTSKNIDEKLVTHISDFSPNYSIQTRDRFDDKL